MNEKTQIPDEELQDLLRRMDDLFPMPEPEPVTPRPESDPEPVLYRNYANNYGAGRPKGSDESVLPVYNSSYRPEPQPEESVSPRPAPRRKRKKRPGCAGVLALLLILVLAAGAALVAMIRPNITQGQPGRKPDTATILLCGTDAEGERTDTMMLLYLSGSEKKAGLLSLPRDTYTITSRGYGAKLNSAYARNGMGAEGMEGLLDYVQEIIGYRPDGYLMVGMDIVPKIVDAMGGLTVEVPMGFELEGVTIQQGLQQLNGIEVLQLLRYRKGYAMQDLGRVEVQRTVLSAAMDQWITPGKIPGALDALELVRQECLTDLELEDLVWIGKTLLLSGGNVESATLPGYADYIGDASYYILYPSQVAELINEKYNPLTEEIKVEDLKIAG